MSRWWKRFVDLAKSCPPRWDHHFTYRWPIPGGYAECDQDSGPPLDSIYYLRKCKFCGLTQAVAGRTYNGAGKEFLDWEELADPGWWSQAEPEPCEHD